jgi:hypothetical protein
LIGIVLCAPAYGGISIVLGSVTPSGANFIWSYNVAISAGQETSGSGDAAVVNAPLTDGTTDITLYDIAGLIAGSELQPAGWTATTALLGDTPGGTTPVDSPTAINITWTYSGAAQITGPLSLGSFSFQSTFGGTGQVIATTFQDQVDTTPDGGAGDDFAEGGLSSVTGPHQSSPVPEPTSILLLGTVLSLAGYRLRRRVM